METIIFCPDFPKIVLKNKMEGVVEIELVINEDCVIEVINITKFLEGSCEEAALKIIRRSCIKMVEGG